MVLSKTVRKFVAFAFLLALELHLTSCSEFYSYSAKDIEGNEFSMEELRGKAVLIVNVASECGFTDQHYTELVQLQKRFPPKDFVILGFPSNQFGQQEPKRNSAILRFVKRYGVNFPMFSKIKVIGELKHPIYKFLERESGYTPIWNFNKYLLDRQGRFVKYWDQSVSPLQCVPQISKLISHAFDSKYETFRVDGEL